MPYAFWCQAQFIPYVSLPEEPWPLNLSTCTFHVCLFWTTGFEGGPNFHWLLSPCRLYITLSPWFLYSSRSGCCDHLNCSRLPDTQDKIWLIGSNWMLEFPPLLCTNVWWLLRVWVEMGCVVLLWKKPFRSTCWQIEVKEFVGNGLMTGNLRDI